MIKQFRPLTDSQWEIIKYFLPIQRKREIDLRDVLNGIFYILRTGVQWRNLPSCFPKWSAVYYYFDIWKKNDTFRAINLFLNMFDRYMQEDQRAGTPSLLLADSQSIKLNPFLSKERGIDGNKRVNGRKRQILTDTAGRIWEVVVHAANISDSIGGQGLLKRLDEYRERLEKIMTDSGYKEQFEVCVKALELTFEVSSKPESTKGFVPIAKRWVVEQTFGCMNFFRRLAKDYEATTQSSEAWITLYNIARILNRNFC